MHIIRSRVQRTRRKPCSSCKRWLGVWRYAEVADGIATYRVHVHKGTFCSSRCYRKFYNGARRHRAPGSAST